MSINISVQKILDPENVEENFIQKEELQAQSDFDSFLKWENTQRDDSFILEPLLSKAIEAEPLYSEFFNQVIDRFGYLQPYFVQDMNSVVSQSDPLRVRTTGYIDPDFSKDIRPQVVIQTEEDYIKRVVEIRINSYLSLFRQLGIEDINPQDISENLDLAGFLVVLHEYGHISELEWKMFATYDYEVLYQDIEEEFRIEWVNSLASVCSRESMDLFLRQVNIDGKEALFFKLKGRKPLSSDELKNVLNEDFKRTEKLYKALRAERFADKFMVYAANEIPMTKEMLENLKSKKAKR